MNSQTIAVCLLTGLLALVPAGGALGQEGEAPSTGEPLSGFSTDSAEPIEIEADELEVFERESRAVFRGNVRVVQGGVTLRSAVLTVFYGAGGEGGSEGAEDAEGAPGAGVSDQSVERIEAEGSVIVTSGDQRATGARAVYETVDETVVLSGDVVLSQGENVVRGQRLTVNLATGQSRMASEGGRVQGLFTPGRRD